MLIVSLVSLVLMLADAPAATPPMAPPAAAAPAAVDPVFGEIDALMKPFKGKSGDRLRGKFGFSSGTRSATDGEVVFWELKVEQEMTCNMDAATMAMRCLRGDPSVCRLAVAFDKQGLVVAWVASGEPRVCRQFVDKLKAP
ncbi:MAG: hypothetical protein ACOYM5_05510 [Caulobacter sp.]